MPRKQNLNISSTLLYTILVIGKDILWKVNPEFWEKKVTIVSKFAILPWNLQKIISTFISQIRFFFLQFRFFFLHNFDKSVKIMNQNHESELEWALLTRYVYTYEEFVIVTEAPQCNRITVTEQDTDNKRTIEKYTNRQCTKWQKHNIQYRQLCVRSDMCTF